MLKIIFFGVDVCFCNLVSVWFCVCYRFCGWEHIFVIFVVCVHRKKEKEELECDRKILPVKGRHILEAECKKCQKSLKFENFNEMPEITKLNIVFFKSRW